VGPVLAKIIGALQAWTVAMISALPIPLQKMQATPRLVRPNWRWMTLSGTAGRMCDRHLRPRGRSSSRALRFAKTMPPLPHEDIRQGDVPEPDFQAFLARIKRHGFRARWRGHGNVYLEVDGWRPSAVSPAVGRLSDQSVTPSASRNDAATFS
jgi:hypothetical protein